MAREPLTDHGGQDFQVVGSSYEHAGRVGEALCDPRDTLRFRWMQHVPTVGVDSIVVELLVTCDAPDIGGDTELPLKNLLCLQNGRQYGSAAEKLRVQFGALVSARAEAV